MQEFQFGVARLHTSVMKRALDILAKGGAGIARLLCGQVLILAFLTLGGTSRSLEAATVSLAWDPPVVNTDGTPVSNLAGYRLYYGTAPHAYSNILTAGTATAVVSNLQEGVTYYFAAVAFNDQGVESSFSEEISWTAPKAPLLDSDGDGMTDIQETAAGTDPNNAGSVLSLRLMNASAGAGGQGKVIQWPSVAGKSYTVLRSTNLMATPAFTPLASHIQGTGSLVSCTDTEVPPNGACFYKIQVE